MKEKTTNNDYQSTKLKDNFKLMWTDTMIYNKSKRSLIIKLQLSYCTQEWTFLARREFKTWRRAHTSWQICRRVESRKTEQTPRREVRMAAAGHRKEGLMARWEHKPLSPKRENKNVLEGKVKSNNLEREQEGNWPGSLLIVKCEYERRKPGGTMLGLQPVDSTVGESGSHGYWPWRWELTTGKLLQGNTLKGSKEIKGTKELWCYTWIAGPTVLMHHTMTAHLPVSAGTILIWSSQPKGKTLTSPWFQQTKVFGHMSRLSICHGR